MSQPHSARQLIECMTDGAKTFGWEKRNPNPGETSDGDWMVGMGMAAAIRGNFLLPAKANMRVETDGTVTVRDRDTLKQWRQDVLTSETAADALSRLRAAYEAFACEPAARIAA